MLAAAAGAGLLAGCGTPVPIPKRTLEGEGRTPVRVLSANFEESLMVAELYAQMLEGDGLVVTRDFHVGPREVYVKLLTDGKGDVVPEFIPAIAKRRLVMLDDPLRLFGTNRVVPLVRRSRGLDIAPALDRLAPHLSTDDLETMMDRVQVDGHERKVVAEQWLRVQGLVSGRLRLGDAEQAWLSGRAACPGSAGPARERR